MTRFSQRVGGQPPFASGLEEATKRLRTATWNALHAWLMPPNLDQRPAYKKHAAAIWNHIGWTTDSVPSTQPYGLRDLRNYWFGCDWLEFFDVFEFCVHYLASYKASAHWYSVIDAVLEQQGCAYRFVAQELAPITNKDEIAEIEAATTSVIDAVATHIRGAINQLPPHANANSRKSVDEAILAVEAALKYLTDSPSATLGDGVKAFEKKYGPLRPGLRRVLETLYAYTNGPDGIRHAIVDDQAREVTVDEARLMLINCSAFANYLIAIAAKAKAGGA